MKFGEVLLKVILVPPTVVAIVLLIPVAIIALAIGWISDAFS
jgi:hypothetical protein